MSSVDRGQQSTVLNTLGLQVVLLVIALLAAGCGDGPSETSVDPPDATPTTAAVTTTSAEPENPSDGAAEELYPDVLDASAQLGADGTWDFSATLSSPYDSPERYADAWRVLGPDDAVYGIRELTHDHAAEQPFTRNLPGVTIPDDVQQVVIEGRDQVSGWGGETVTIELDRG